MGEVVFFNVLRRSQSWPLFPQNIQVKLKVFIRNPVPGHLGYDGGCAMASNILVTIYYHSGGVQAAFHIP